MRRGGHTRARDQEQIAELVIVIAAPFGESEGGLEERVHEEWIRAFEDGLKHYRKQEWDQAAELFGACQSLRAEDKPSAVFLERIGELRKQAPADWDGAWKLVSK